MSCNINLHPTGDPTEPGAAGAGGSCTGGAGVGGAGAVDTRAGGAGGTVRPRPYFVPLLKQVLGLQSSSSLSPSLPCPPPDQSQPLLLPASPLPAPSPYIEQPGGVTERCEPASRRVSPVRTARYAPRLRPPPVPSMHAMALSVADPSFEPAPASALVAELLDFAAACRLDYATALVAESASASPPSVGEAITGPYSSRWQASMDAEKASWKSTGTYVNEIPPPGVNIVDGMWIFRGVDYFQTFSSTPKMTTPRVLLHVAAQPLGFAPSTADPSLFLRTNTSMPPFYVLVYVDDLVFASADTEALILVLQRFGLQFSLSHPTPLSTGHSLSAPPSDKSPQLPATMAVTPPLPSPAAAATAPTAAAVAPSLPSPAAAATAPAAAAGAPPLLSPSAAGTAPAAAAMTPPLLSHNALT
ncbi:unnamed protein product [Closterium sp. NIES-53]